MSLSLIDSETKDKYLIVVDILFLVLLLVLTLTKFHKIYFQYLKKLIKFYRQYRNKFKNIHRLFD
jgi:hypothetical protein